MHIDDFERSSYFAGGEPRALTASLDAPRNHRKMHRAIGRLEREIEIINARIERLQEKRAAFRSQVTREMNLPWGKEGRWLSLNSAMLLLTGALDGLMRGFNPLLPGLVVSLMLALWVVYIHHQMDREKAARVTDMLLHAQIRDQFSRMENLHHRLSVLRKNTGDGPHQV